MLEAGCQLPCHGTKKGEPERPSESPLPDWATAISTHLALSLYLIALVNRLCQYLADLCAIAIHIGMEPDIENRFELCGWLILGTSIVCSTNRRSSGLPGKFKRPA